MDWSSTDFHSNILTLLALGVQGISVVIGSQVLLRKRINKVEIVVEKVVDSLQSIDGRLKNLSRDLGYNHDDLKSNDEGDNKRGNGLWR